MIDLVIYKWRMNEGDVWELDADRVVKVLNVERNQNATDESWTVTVLMEKTDDSL